MISLSPAALGLALLLLPAAAVGQPPSAAAPQVPKAAPVPKAPPALVKELTSTFARLKSLLKELEGIRAKAMGPVSQAQRSALVSKFNSIRGEFVKTRNDLLQKVEKAHKAFPGDPGVAGIHIQFALGRKDWKSALADADVLVRARPKDQELAGQRAFIYLQLGRLQDTVKEIRRLRKLAGKPHLETPLLAQCLANMGKYDQALAEIAAFRKATGDASALAQMEADCLFQLHKWEDAAKAAQKAVTLFSSKMASARNMQEAQRIRAGLQQMQKLLQACKDYPAYLAKEKELEAAEEKKGDDPIVAIETNRGTIEVELFEDSAPNTVANFIELAEKGFYDGTRFHRVIPGFMIQGGDPNSKNDDPSDDGTGGPGYKFADECRNPGARKHFAGSISMANSGPDTNGSQFFITQVITWHLNGRHTVFGRVIKGMDVVLKTRKGDVIKKVKVLRKRDHPYKVKKLE